MFPEKIASLGSISGHALRIYSWFLVLYFDLLEFVAI